MTVNTDKTEIVHFRPSRCKRTPFHFTFDDNILRVVENYKYLGVYFDEHMTFMRTASALASSSSRALGSVRYRLKFLKECRCSTFTTLYSSCICPIMDYAAGVWGTKKFDCLENVQFRAIRYFLGVHRFAPHSMLLGDIGWVPCFVRHKLAMLRLWNRLVTLPATRLTFKIFLYDFEF